MFEKKKAVVPFHIFNLLIITMASIAVFMGVDGQCFRSSYQHLTTINYFYIYDLTDLF